MYRTDKQFMKNPATAPSRIYIGALSKATVADDLEKIFMKHGTITGMALNTGFAFIQFENEHEARQAIQAENGTILNGRKIVVKQALDKSKSGMGGPMNHRPPPPIQKPQSFPSTPSGLGSKPTGPVSKPTGPVSKPTGPVSKPTGPVSKPTGPISKPSVPVAEPLPKLNLPPPQNASPPANQNQPESRQQFTPDPEPPEENIEDDHPNIRPPNQFNDDRNKARPKRGMGRGKVNDRFDRFEGSRDLRFEPPPVEPFRGRDPYYGRDNFGPPRIDSFAMPPVIDVAPPAVDKNDCEIIVVSKSLTEYAEFIEAKLKNLGLIVDLLFPNEDVPIGKVLANISSRGCLYAILVTPINEENRSLTLSILHGSPQEHRNMPVEDALILISHNFEAYMKGEHLPAESMAEMKITDRHPAALQILINLLAENRQLTTVQYDQLIKYLQERKELQHEFEVAQGITLTEESDPKQAELQTRILNILNKTDESKEIPSSITSTESSAPGDAPILKDPTVQKALDSLLMGDMLKNIAGV